MVAARSLKNCCPDSCCASPPISRTLYPFLGLLAPGSFAIKNIDMACVRKGQLDLFASKFLSVLYMLCSESIYFLFMTSTYRDLAGFFAPRAPDAGRLDNNASSGSTFCGGAGNAVDDGLEGGNPGIDVVVGGVAVAGGTDTDGVGAGGCVVIVEAEATGVDEATTEGTGGVTVAGVVLFGGGGGGAAFAGTSPA